jgi:hypothetical protein
MDLPDHQAGPRRTNAKVVGDQATREDGPRCGRLSGCGAGRRERDARDGGDARPDSVSGHGELLHREPFQMVTAIQQPGHCLCRVRKPVSPQAPDE